MENKRSLAFFIVLLCLLGLLLWFKRSPNEKSIVVPDIEKALPQLNTLHNIIPVAVIGSGPAGLSAAMYCARSMNLYTVVFKGSMPGGQLMGTSTVENWPGVGSMVGPEIMRNMEKHVEHFGVKFSNDSIERCNFKVWPFVLTTDEGKEVRALAVIIATGSTPLHLQCPGEERYWGHGVSSCATCDAPFYKNRDVAVVGGGDSAAEAALQLAASSHHVTILVRGDTMRASSVMQKRLRYYRNIEIRYNTKITKINGDDSHVRNIDVITKDHPDTIAVDGIFVAIGYKPNSELFKNQIALDKYGYIITPKREGQETSVHGVFVAGDVADFRYRQAGVAAGDGIKAGLDVIAFLRDHNFTEVADKQLERNYFDTATATLNVKIPIIASKSSFLLETTHENRPIVVDFYAPYCASCMRMIPVFESAAAKLGDHLKFIKVDVSQSKELPQIFDVPMVPTIIVIKDNKVVSRSTEVMGKRQMISYLSEFIAPL